MTARDFLNGDVRGATTSYLQLPDRVTSESNWEADLALCLLESGDPAGAGEHFTKALTLWPSIPTRKVIAFYLEKLGKPVPPAPSQETPSEAKPPAAADSAPAAEAAEPSTANPPAETPKSAEGAPKGL